MLKSSKLLPPLLKRIYVCLFDIMAVDNFRSKNPEVTGTQRLCQVIETFFGFWIFFRYDITAKFHSCRIGVPDFRKKGRLCERKRLSVALF